MSVLSKSHSRLLTEKEQRPFSELFQDTTGKDLPSQGPRIGLREKLIVLSLLGLSTDISSVGLHTPSLFATAVGSSVTWQEHPPLSMTWFKGDMNSRGREKLAELKAKMFDPNTKKERVERALKLLSDLKPIEGIDKATWKSIVEETAIEDTYGD